MDACSAILAKTTNLSILMEPWSHNKCLAFSEFQQLISFSAIETILTSSISSLTVFFFSDFFPRFQLFVLVNIYEHHIRKV